MSTGENIRKIRLKKGYSQQFLADSLGISQSKFNRIEGDQASISASDLVKICEILDTNLNELLSKEKWNVHNNNFNDNSILYNNIENFFSGQKELYEDQISSLKEETKALREQVAELLKLVANKG